MRRGSVRCAVVAGAVFLGAWPVAAAQRQVGVIAGIVYDSAAAAPLAGAVVAVVGVYATGETDEQGRFRIEGVPPGEYEVSFHHARLGDYGVTVAAQSVVVATGATVEAYLAVPSLESMLTAWCRSQPGRGDAHVAGVVSNDRTDTPLAGAQVEAFVESGAGSMDRQVLATTNTVTGGEYRFCNLDVADDERMLLRATFGNNESEPVEIGGPGARMQDVVVNVSDPVAIMGTVVDHATQKPLAGAAVSLAGTGSGTYTNEDGKFAFVGVTPGRHVVETKQMGYSFRADTLAVLGNAFGLRIPLAVEAIALAPVVVATPGGSSSTRRNLASRFQGLTETEMDAIRDRTFDMADVLQSANIPGISITDMYDQGSFVRIGICVSSRRAMRRNPGSSACQPMAVFIDDVLVGGPESRLMSMSPTNVASVQFIPAIEARLLYGLVGSDGVLLIYTRRN